MYAVQTTGVFCRPSCAARTPKPENVVFFETPADALAAGREFLPTVPLYLRDKWTLIRRKTVVKKRMVDGRWQDRVYSIELYAVRHV